MTYSDGEKNSKRSSAMDEDSTTLSEETQRRRWHEEDFQRLQKGLCRVQYRMAGVSLGIIVTLGTILWWYTQSDVTELEKELIKERGKIEAQERRVTELVGTLVGVDRFDALGQKVRDNEGAISATSATLYELRKYLEQVDRSVGLVNTTVGTLARDLDRDRDVREKMLNAMQQLSERLEQPPIR